MSITLTNELAEIVQSKVANGEYASESEVIRDGLRTLLARDRAMEDWLRVQIAPLYDALEANPDSGVSTRRVRARLAGEHAKLAR